MESLPFRQIAIIASVYVYPKQSHFRNGLHAVGKDAVTKLRVEFTAHFPITDLIVIP